MESSLHSGSETADSRLLPTQPVERYEIVDVVRGFALLGVVVVNWYYTGTRTFLTLDQLQALPTTGVDRVVRLLDELLFDDKFYTLFSLLFGLGFALQLQRAARRGTSLVPIYVRRLAILFFIGIGHAVLLYYGDILHVYALLGFLLLLFRNQSDRSILAWAFGVGLLVLMLPTLEWFVSLRWPEALVFEGPPIPRAERLAAVTDGGWSGVVWLNTSLLRADYVSVWDVAHWYLGIFSRFLFGFYVGRRALLQRADEHIRLYRRLFPWALLIGLVGNGAHSASLWLRDPPVYLLEAPFPERLLWILVECGILAMALAYVCSLVLIYQTPKGRRLVGVLAPLGRMALTNYLTQSLVFVFLFYGVGLGMVGRVGTAVATLSAVGMFLVQILLSALWLRHFRFGPAEWVWRCSSYGKWVPIRSTA